MDKDGHGISIEYIESENQIADILTKGLGAGLFYPLRDKLMGWTGKSDQQQKEKQQINDALEGELKNAESATDDGQTASDAQDAQEGGWTRVSRRRIKPSHKMQPRLRRAQIASNSTAGNPATDTSDPT